MMAMCRRMFVAVLVACLLLSNVSIADAMLSEAASLAITAAGGMLQEDDKKLEQDIIRGLADDSQKQKLRDYVEKTRPMIQEKRKFFDGVMTPAFLWVYAHSPTVGNMLMGTVISAYIMHYESQLEDGADSEVTKKFAELREHNIDAGQGLFEVFKDLLVSHSDKDNSGLGLIGDTAFLATEGYVYDNRYKSSAAAIATVLEAAGIAMQPEDIGDICSGQNGKVTHNTDNVNDRRMNVQAEMKSNGSNASNAGIGNIRLDENMESVNGKLGNPDKKKVKESGKVDCSYGNTDVTFANGRVIGIAVDDINMRTPKGIHAGSTLQEVLNTYGADYMLSDYGGLDLYEYEYRDGNGKTYYLRFAVKQASGVVSYISVRYVD